MDIVPLSPSMPYPCAIESMQPMCYALYYGAGPHINNITALAHAQQSDSPISAGHHRNIAATFSQHPGTQHRILPNERRSNTTQPAG